MPTKKYELHPLCTLFPRLSQEDIARLADDIKINGLREPITLHDGMILDGGNRYAACLAAGIEPRFVKFKGASIAAFVLSENLHRRHLTPGQQAAIVASVQDWARAQGHGGDRSSAHESTCKDTTKTRAKQSGASVSTQRRADAVAKADPGLAKKVAHGEVSLPEAVAKVAPKLAARKPRPVAGAPAEVTDYDPRDDQIKEAQDTIAQLADENDRLKDRIAVEAWDTSEAEKLDASQIIESLRAEVATLRAERDALIVSRDKYQTECAQMKRQLAAQRREIAKLQKVAA